ncbi:MAG: hypothetical protein Q4D98_03135 [Planctomycetia bacterium]|nr:hypothetical protein [Planctomycetia bacterium]
MSECQNVIEPQNAKKTKGDWDVPENRDVGDFRRFRAVRGE